MSVLGHPDGPAASSDFSAALLDAMADPSAVLNADGVVVAVNRAWRMFCADNDGDPERTGIGVSYLDVCMRAAADGCADAQVAAAGLRAVLAGEAVERSLDYECSSASLDRWFMLRVTPVRHHQLAGALVSHVNITRRKRVVPDLREFGALDPVTRLPGRELLAGRFIGPGGRAVAAAQDQTGVIYLHLEGLAGIADAFGEAARDEVLQTVGRRLAAVTRYGDGIARLGAGEFAIAAPRMTATGLTGLLARVRHALSEAFLVQGHAVELGATVGMYLAAAGEQLTDCLRLADEASFPIRLPRPPLDRLGQPLHGAIADDHPPADQAQDAGQVLALRRPAVPGPHPPPADPTEAPDPDGVPGPGTVIAADPRRLELTVAVERALAERTAELQLRAGELAAANRELEDFAYSVSHDLRAPLRAMSGFARILVEDHLDGLDPKTQDYLERIRASAGEMAQQLDGLLMISRLQRRRLSHVELDMSATARTAWEQVEPAGRRVKFHVAELPCAVGDPELVAQLFGRLLDNAVKFTARVSEPRIEVTADGANDSIGYVVTDNGVGFDLLRAGRLFRPFQRLHPAHEYPGIGLGLAVAQQIVRRHCGTIEAEAAPELGARFRFTLGR